MKIKFCGGCNQLYNRKEVFQRLTKNNNLNKIDKIIILNGCQRGCRKIIGFSVENNDIINTQDYLVKTYPLEINEESVYSWILEEIKKKSKFFYK